MASFIEAGTLVLDPTLAHETTLDDYMRDRRAELFQQKSVFEDTPLTKILMGRKGKSCEAEKVEYSMERYNPNFVYIDCVYTNSAHHGDASPASAIAAGVTTAAGATVYIRLYGANNAARLQNAYGHLPYEEREIIDVARGLSIHVDVSTITHDVTYPYATAKTLEADAPVSAANVLSQFTVSNSNLISFMLSVAVPEMSGLGEGAFEQPTNRYNMCQIMNRAYSISGTEANKTSVFTASVKERKRNQTFTAHREAMERAFLLGTRIDPVTDALGVGVGAIGVNRYGAAPHGNRARMGGLRWFLNEYEPNNVINIPRTTTFEGRTFTDKTFDERGEEFLDALCYKLSMFGGGTKLALCGGKAMSAINTLLGNMTSIQRPPTYDGKWGFKVKMFESLNMNLEFKQSATLSTCPGHERDMFIINPDRMQWRPFKNRDLHFIESAEDIKKFVENGFTWVDGSRSGLFQHGTLLVDNLSEFAWVKGVGLNFETS